MNVQKKWAFKIIRIQLNLLSRVSHDLTGKQGFRLFTTPLSVPKHKKKSLFNHHEPLSFKWKGLNIRGYRVPGSNGKKALILHGFSSTLHSFAHYIEPLNQLGYEVMAFDAPAHGHSDGKRVHAIDYAAVINEIIHRYGPIDTFIAHSFGGLGVMLALETNPQSPNTKVVLIAPATETTSAIQSGLKMLGVNNNKVQTALENEVVRISGRPVTWFSIKRAIKNVQAKVLWIHDKDDIITPLEDVEPLVSTPPQHVTFHITEGLGHHKIYKDPSVIERIVSFLQLVK